jgi:hypothetical protein
MPKEVYARRLHNPKTHEKAKRMIDGHLKDYGVVSLKQVGEAAGLHLAKDRIAIRPTLQHALGSVGEHVASKLKSGRFKLVSLDLHNSGIKEGADSEWHLVHESIEPIVSTLLGSIPGRNALHANALDALQLLEGIVRHHGNRRLLITQSKVSKALEATGAITPVYGSDAVIGAYAVKDIEGIRGAARAIRHIIESNGVTPRAGLSKFVRPHPDDVKDEEVRSELKRRMLAGKDFTMIGIAQEFGVDPSSVSSHLFVLAKDRELRPMFIQAGWNPDERFQASKLLAALRKLRK